MVPSPAARSALLATLSTVLVSAVFAPPAAAAKREPVLDVPLAAPHFRVDDRTYKVPRISEEITVDARLDEPAWRGALSMELRYEVNPGENVAPPVRTEVLVAHDDDNVYFAFRAFDPEPGSIRAHFGKRDEIGSDDWVGVVLDTFNDERRAFDLIVNPVGVQYDQVETTNGEEEWDAIWDAAARITEDGYQVEMRVPFTSLRFQEADGEQVWGFDAVRSYPRSDRHQIGLFPRDRSNNCYFCQTVKLQGFEGVARGRNLEIAPTVTAVQAATRPVGGSFGDPGWDNEAGLTARWGITPGLTLSGTVNPDFSQVEADALQLDVNQPFALSYAEKRPFFMEAADVFSTQLDAVYTRSIRSPAWGAKLTGGSDAGTFGGFVVRDDVTNILLPGSQSSTGLTLDQPATAAVLRYTRDLGNRFTVGGLLTDREGDGYHNRLAGFDANLRLSDVDRVRVQLMASDTRYPDAVGSVVEQRDGLRDWAGELVYSHTTRTHGWWAAYQDIGAEFRADLGFMPRVDLRHAEAGANVRIYPGERPWFTELRFETQVRHVTEHDGDLLFSDATLQAEYIGAMQSHALAEVTRGRQAWAGQEFDLWEVMLHNCMKPGPHTHVYGNIVFGDAVDYAGARKGDRVRLQGGVVQNLGRHLKLDLSGTREEMDVDEGWLYDATIAAAGISYQLTTRTQVRTILQWTDYAFASELYPDGRDPQSERLFTQALFSYMLNPQTVLFLGYSDASLGWQDTPLTRTERTIFAKVGYAWML